MTGEPAIPEQRPRWIVRLMAGLNRWSRPTPDGRFLEPLIAARELQAWADDDGRWPARPRDWHSLLDDVIASWSRLGPELRTAVDIDAHLDALADIRAQTRIAEDPHRPLLQTSARALERSLVAPDALTAAANDVVAAAQASRVPNALDNETRWRLALLATVGELHGHDWAIVADRIRRAFEWTRGRPLDDTLQQIDRALSTRPGHGHSIVWLAIDHAYVSRFSPHPVVQLFDGDWLLAVLREWDGPRDGVPPELAADPARLPQACGRYDDDDEIDERLPVVFARIDLGVGPTAGARERAHDILELLLSRASVRQRGTNWRIHGVCLHFVDGDLIFESTGPVGDPDIYQRLRRSDVVQDPTGSTINDEAARLADHLHAISPELHAALQLNKWLSDARRTAPPARLVLAGRILEQAANWAGQPVPAVIADYLAPAWCWRRIAADLSRAGWTAVLRLRGADGTTSSQHDRETFLEVSRTLLDDRDAIGRRAHPWRTLERLGWLVAQHPADSEVGALLRTQEERLVDGPTTARSIAQLRDELAIWNARGIRTRNAIVHGGPLLPAIADNVVGTQDALAHLALDWVIGSLAGGESVAAGFVRRRTRYVTAIERLAAGGLPTVELPQPVAADD